ncbi:hypothetical protein RE428_01480 [Marinobacter nanhaiticus D15-8W]|uniref:DUF2218 domain-containing protein n=1 Tax=Marinobacter nanhaiticus D15-8W TaxID=626887 RepID=N6W4T9_9GAMM|nr:DUF2218 domain-containing protein [Marinobacter nanhaiticus]ENO15169.1 DUF2218 domain-containing protein [Marinobacter nanhaiticus D15-8W]BES69130.1 hypothetical protein RE428_01480 [Marinobacter nanhaiticus D15-8W]
MLKAIANVETASPSINMKKLLRHFSHKIEVQFDDHIGSASFPFGDAYLEAGESVLAIHVKADDEESMTRLQAVIADHLVRFASKETLTIQWESVTP